MFYKLLVSNLLLFTLMNCQTQKLEQNKNPAKVENSASENVGNLIYLKEGETKFLIDQQMNVTFVGITADSRCPEGVNCVLQGAATASITIMTTTSRPMQIELSTLNIPSKTMTKTRNIAGYNIILDKVLPSPNEKNNQITMKGNYQIALKIEKGNADEKHTSNPATNQ